MNSLSKPLALICAAFLLFIMLSGCGSGNEFTGTLSGASFSSSSACMDCHGTTYSADFANVEIGPAGAFYVGTNTPVPGAPSLAQLMQDISDTHFDDWRIQANGNFVSSSTSQIEGYVLNSAISWAPDGQGYVLWNSPSACAASCHDFHNEDLTINNEWYESGHANVLAGAFTSTNVSGNVCQRCHSSAGFANYVSAGNTAYPMWDTTSIGKALSHITCTACHDGTAYPTETSLLLRKSGIANFISGNANSTGTGFTSFEGALNAGASASCIVCHQGYLSGYTLYNTMIAKTSVDLCNPIDNSTSLKDGGGGPTAISRNQTHYLASAAVLFGMKGFEYNATSVTTGYYTPGNPFHQSLLCVGCHMSGGSHEMRPSIDVCRGCHGQVESFEDIGAFRDMDGDGIAGRPKDEIDGLISKINAELTARGVIVYTSWPYYRKSVSDWTEYELIAAFNADFIHHDPGAYAHNFRYAVQLLRDSYAILNGTSLPGVRPSTGDDRVRADYWNSCP